VKDVFGLKIENKPKIQRIHDALLAVLAEPAAEEGAPAAAPAAPPAPRGRRDRKRAGLA
jgi:hypothetical protein